MVRLSAVFAALVLTIPAVGAGHAVAQPKTEILFESSHTLKEAHKALDKDDTKRAIELYERALKKGVSGVERYGALNNYCIALYFEKFYDRAVERCREAIATQSNRWQAYNNLGIVLRALGRYAEAVDTFERALNLSPNNERIKRNLDLARRMLRTRPHSPSS